MSPRLSSICFTTLTTFEDGAFLNGMVKHALKVHSCILFLTGSLSIYRLVGAVCKFTDQARTAAKSAPLSKGQLVMQKHALDLLVKVIKSIHDWFFERCSETPVAPSATTSPSASSGRSRDVIHDRRGTVLLRFSKHKEAKKMKEKAIRLASESGIKHCIKYLITMGLLDPSADAIASFLHENLEALDASMLGEYLGGTRTAKEEPFEEEIRTAYIRRFEYPPSDLVAAMRQLLTEQGFHLPVETQKIERILSSFGEVYYERNRSRFLESDAPLVLSFLLLLVNTSLHNPNVKSVDRMSLSTFLKSTRSIKCSYSDQEFENMYRVLVREPFAFAIMQPGETPKQKVENRLALLSKDCKRIIRRVNVSITWHW